MTEVTRERVRPSLSLYLLILHPVPTNRSAPSLAPFFLGVRIPLFMQLFPFPFIRPFPTQPISLS